MITKYIKYLFTEPGWIIANTFLGRYLSDRLFLKIKYKHIIGEYPNLEHPVGFNEKIQWLKLYHRIPILTQLVDKFEAKQYVSREIGREYVIENYGVWDDFDDINFNILPEQFVLKTTHDCGGVVICRDKNSFDFKAAKRKLTKHLTSNHYYTNREWAYKSVKPRIIAEKYFTNGSEEGESEELIDYKFSCFSGEPKLLQISTGRFGAGLRHNFYDMNFQRLNIIKFKGGTTTELEKPEGFEKMIQFAKQLSSIYPFVRIDFYNINGQIYFGEFTFYPGGGFSLFKPDEWEQKAGDWIDLPRLKDGN